MTDDGLDLSTAPAQTAAGAGTPTAAAPAEVVAPLVLSPPEPPPVVTTSSVAGMVPIPADRVGEIGQRARGFVESLRDSDPRSPEFRSVVESIDSMGRREMSAASQSSNRMLTRPVAALASARGEGADAQKTVADGLIQLRVTVEDLDPSAVGDTVSQALRSLIPFRTKIKSYFGRYQAAQSHLDAIIRSLQHGQDELRRDNAAIDGEKTRLWELMGTLQEYAVLAEALDRELVVYIDTVRAVEPDRADALTSDLLFAVRQKHQDVLTQLAVAAQGYLALDVIRRNNLELVRGVERATGTTVAALRTAVMAAQALANQKLVLDQIEALGATTSNLIVATSEMLRTQSGRVAEQAAGPAVSMDALRTSFANIYQTLDAIDAYRLRAVDTMASTVETLSGQLDLAAGHVERVRERDEREGSGA